MALDHALDEGPLRESLMEIRKAGERASALTRKLLAYGRKQLRTPGILNLNAVAADMHAMLERLIPANVELSLVLDPNGYPRTAIRWRLTVRPARTMRTQ